MKCSFAVAGIAAVFLGGASPVAAEPRDSVERSHRMDTDAIRDDVRTNRLQIPRHPLAVEQPSQTAPDPKAKAKSRKSGRSGN